jgi:SNF2 family DNA or RNA helicase
VAMHLDPHQLEGAARAARDRRHIFAWDVGTGKTLPALAASLKPCLVVAPAYLLWNWAGEIKNMSPDASVVVVSGTPDEKRRLVLTRPDFTVMTYNYMAELYPWVVGQQWGTIIFDEAHRLRGRNSKRTKASYKLRSERTFLLTGTEIVKNAGDMYPLLRLCDSNRYTSYWRFVNEWCYVTQNPWTTVVGSVRDPERFQAEIAPYVSTLAFNTVYPDIPEASWTRIPATLTANEQTRHKTALKQYILDGAPLSGAGALIPALRSITAHSHEKMACLQELIAENSDRKIIVWTWYRDTARLVFDHGVVSPKRPKFFATGDVSATARVKQCREFLRTKNGVLFANISALSEGQNLQESNMNVFYELSYLPSDITQCVGRQRRRGQTHPVECYAIVANSSIDSSIYNTVRRRDASNSEAKGVQAVLADLMKGK